MHRLASLTVALLALGSVYAADAPLTGLRGSTPLDQEPKAPRLASIENVDGRRPRAYASQPPTIPHPIEKYEITRNVNFCMYCHARTRTEASRAPMVSTSHYLDRDHDPLAEISPRRYFCTACHVPQTGVRPPLGNSFVDVDHFLKRGRSAERAAQERHQELHER